MQVPGTIRVMLRLALGLLFFLYPFINVSGQQFLNGSFELNKLTGDKTDMKNLVFDTMVYNTKAFSKTGADNEGAIDLIKSTGYCGGAENGSYFIAIQGQNENERFSMELDLPLDSLQCYKISYYYRACFPVYSNMGAPLLFGLSRTGKVNLDTVAIRYVDTNNVSMWLKDSFLFSPSIRSNYITVELLSYTSGSWMQLDHFTIEMMTKPFTQIFNRNDTVICAGSAITLNAGKGNDLSYEWESGSTDSLRLVDTPGIYRIRVSNGCWTITDSITVAFDSILPFSIGADTTFCNGGNITLNTADTNTIYSNLWSTGVTTRTITVNAPGKYWLRKTNANGCSNMDTIEVFSIPMPNAHLGPDRDTCQGSTITISAGNSGFRYLWNTGDTTQSILASSSGSYKVKVYNTLCFDEDSLKVTYHAPGSTDLGPDQSKCFVDGETATLDAGPGSTYLWNTGYNGQFEIGGSPGIYWVRVTDQYGCISSDTITLTSQCSHIPQTSAVYIPNSFTPNGDSRNDVFEVVGRNITEYSISIFDRWGMKVFESNDIATSWDGSFRGEPVLTNGFVYVVSYTDLDGTVHKKTGEIYLLK